MDDNILCIPSHAESQKSDLIYIMRLYKKMLLNPKNSFF